MRRIVLAGLALVAAATVFEAPAAHAQVSSSKNPWCIRDGANGGPGSWDCSYYNLRQCEFTAQGSGGTCTRNPNYRGGRRGARRPSDEGTWGWGGGRW